jgi:hypothetical protein
VGQHEDGNLELVVADVRVRLAHLERPFSHEDRTCLFDRGIHVHGASKGRKVRIETGCTAGLVSDEPVD